MNLIQVIKDYVQDDKSGGAILINGPWGGGKSYYLREKIIPELEKSTASKDSKSKKQYKCLYISLNGIKSVEEIMNQIVFAKLPWTDKKVTKIAASLGGMLVNALAKMPPVTNVVGNHSTEMFKGFKIQDYLNFETNIICIDDFERLGNGITPEEVLGFINVHFIEMNRVKCLIVGNEAELEVNPRYLKIKEKTIARTLNFDRSNVLLSEVLNRYKGDFKYYNYLLGKEA